MKTTISMTEWPSKPLSFFTVLALSDFFIFLGLWRYIGWRLGLLLDLQTAEPKSNEDFDSLI
jgi:hypothetical protein